MNTQQPIQIPATQVFTVQLEAQQWNAVLAALHDAPFRIAAPLVQAISEQLQSAAGQVPNGEIAASPPTH